MRTDGFLILGFLVRRSGVELDVGIEERFGIWGVELVSIGEVWGERRRCDGRVLG